MAHTFDNATVAVPANPSQGRPVAPVISAASKWNLPPSKPFIYVYHPERWGLFEDEWLPQLAQIALDPGVGGVDKNGNPREAVNDHVEGGWQPIGGPQDYCMAFDGNQGEIVLSKWETPRNIGHRTVIDSDRAGHKAWLRSLITNKVIAPPDPTIIAGMIDIQQEKVNRIGTDSERGRAARGSQQSILDRMLSAPVPGSEEWKKAIADKVAKAKPGKEA